MVEQMTVQMLKQDTKIERIHKSNKLPQEVLTALIARAAEYPSLEVAAENIGLANRGTLSRILKNGTCNHENLVIIRTAINVSVEPAKA